MAFRLEISLLRARFICFHLIFRHIHKKTSYETAKGKVRNQKIQRETGIETETDGLTGKAMERS